MLMKIDSQITAEIINIFTIQKKPILPVHDSYIVETRDVDLLRDAMSKATISIVKKELSAEQDISGYSDLMRMQKEDRDRFLNTFKDILTLKDKTPEYEERLLRFVKYRKSQYDDTYWLVPPSNHY